MILTRADWGSTHPRGGNPINVLVDEIYVHHFNSGIQPVTVDAEGRLRMRSAQAYHANAQGWGDIGYSWCVDDAGNIYEGRGWGRTGAHTYGHNSKGYGICWLGDSNVTVPTVAALNAIAEVVVMGIRDGWVRSSPTIVAHRDRVPDTSCCGDRFYDLLPVLRRYVHELEHGAADTTTEPTTTDEDDMRAWQISDGPSRGTIVFIGGTDCKAVTYPQTVPTWPDMHKALVEMAELGVLTKHADGQVFKPITGAAVDILRAAR